MKKLLTLFTLVCMVGSILLLAGCYGGEVDSTLTITSAEGAGKKVMVTRIYNDDAITPGGTDKVADNSKAMPKGIEGIVDSIKAANKLDGLKVTSQKNVTKDYDTITIEFEFDSIADYNKKMKTLAQDGTVKEATLTADGDKVTFKEDITNFKNSMMWAVTAIYNDPVNFDKKIGKPDGDIVEIDTLYAFQKYNVAIGATVETVDFVKTTTGNIEATGNIKDEADPSTADTSEASEAGASNPTTGVGSTAGILFGVIAVAVTGIAVASSKVATSKKN